METRELWDGEALRALAREVEAAQASAQLEAVLGACERAAAAGPARLLGPCAPGVRAGFRALHEALDRCLRGYLLAEHGPAHWWSELLLPDEQGQFGWPLLSSNALWLRLAGSPAQARPAEPLPDPWPGELRGQALALGRLAVSTDAGRAISYHALVRGLDPRLLPFATSWLLSVYLQSPYSPVREPEASHQRRAAEEFAEHWQGLDLQWPVAPRAFGATYLHSYRSDRSVVPFARLTAGGCHRATFDRVRAATPPLGAPAPWAAALRGRDFAVLCSMWREASVIYRCQATLLDGQRRAGAPLLCVTADAEQARERAPAPWSPQLVTHTLAPGRPLLPQLAEVAEQLAAAEVDVLYFPEVGLSNDSTWLATQRLARLQVTGYGHPVSSGSAHMDYFVGGADVESGEAPYVEQLVLLPGLGVGTTEPPRAPAPRSRPIDHRELRVVSLASPQKLVAQSLRAYAAGCAVPGATLHLYPALSGDQLDGLAEDLRGELGRTPHQVHGRVSRERLAQDLLEADLCLDAFPYGGYNTLVEALAAGCPVVTLEGTQARGRFGAAMLRRLGCPEFLIARSVPEFVAAARRVLLDAGLRAELRAQLADRDRVLARLVDSELPRHFDAALDWMRERGPRRGRRPSAPVYIAAGEAPRVIGRTLYLPPRIAG
jgi:hypothetical protein